MNFSFVTYLGSDNYLPGTLAIFYSLKQVKSKYHLTVMVSENVSMRVCKVLSEKQIKIVKIQSLIPNNFTGQVNAKEGYAQWNNTFSKLYAFNLTQFDKIVFLDSDMFLIHNVDNLFELPHLSAVIAGKSYPGNQDWQDMNSGLMVIIPNKSDFKKLLNTLSEYTSSHKFGDQDIINHTFPDWPNKHYLHLSEKYNVIARFEPFYRSRKFPVFVIHFTGNKKPWMYSKGDLIQYKIKLITKQLILFKNMKGISQSLCDLNNYLDVCKKFI